VEEEVQEKVQEEVEEEEERLEDVQEDSNGSENQRDVLREDVTRKYLEDTHLHSMLFVEETFSFHPHQKT